MVQSMVSVVVTSLIVWVSIPYIGTLDPLGMVQGRYTGRAESPLPAPAECQLSEIAIFHYGLLDPEIPY